MMKRLILILIAIMASLILAVACAPNDSGNSKDSVASISGKAAGAWTAQSDCGDCHSAEVESGSDNTRTFSLHTTLACHDCHTDNDGKLTMAHAKYDSAEQSTKLKRTKVASETCEGCHDVTELEALTSESDVLIDKNGVWANPHELEVNDAHDSEVNCSSCHKMHNTASPEAEAQKLCLGCHHAQVFECGTCHE